MTRRTRFAVVAAAAATLSAVATVAPASAAELTIADARGDVWRETSSTAAELSPTTVQGDLTRTVVRYKGGEVLVRLYFADLRRKDAYEQFAVRLQGKQGKVIRTVLVETSRRDPKGVHRVFNRSNSEVSCDAKHKVTYSTNRVTVKLARDCLGSPGAVRVNVNAARATTTHHKDSVFYFDSGHDTAAESAAWSDWVSRN
ncbi:MAG TPA: hypothetical protein VFY86_06380 [Nocardioides sp.]|nr:hypothetical protein [Nocardioides sp.]